MNPIILTKNSGAILGPIANLMGYLMNGIFFVLNKIGVPNIGLAIIILTILIYMALLPLTIKQQKFSKLQRKMQPELNRIQKKYEGKKDNVSMMRQQEEIKAVYSKYGVSTMGSCVQLLIQMPILLAMYRVFWNIPAYVPMIKQAFFPLVDNLIASEGSAEYMQALTESSQFAQFAKQFTNESFTSGVTEYVQNTYIDVLNKFSTADWSALTEKFSALSSDIAATTEKLSVYNNFLGLNMANSPSYVFREGLSSGRYVLVIVALIIPVLAAVTQWLSVKMMPTADTGNPNDQMAATMRTMNITMPLMSAVFCFSLPSGMGLYWIAGAVVRAIQQFFINKHIDKMDIDAMIEKNLEKMKEKEAKSGKKAPVNDYSGMSTRAIDRRKDDRYNTAVSKETEQKLQESRNSGKGRKYKAGSLASKAAMVDDFNDIGKK